MLLKSLQTVVKRPSSPKRLVEERCASIIINYASMFLIMNINNISKNTSVTEIVIYNYSPKLDILFIINLLFLVMKNKRHFQESTLNPAITLIDNT